MRVRARRRHLLLALWLLLSSLTLVRAQTCAAANHNCPAGYTRKDATNCGGTCTNALCCTANACNSATNAAANADYVTCRSAFGCKAAAACNAGKTGEMCDPGCLNGYRKTQTGAPFALVCAAAGTYTDSSGTTCAADACTLGARSATPNVDYSSCTTQVTGGTCTPTCVAGYRAVGGAAINPLLCMSMDGATPGYYFSDTSGLTCTANTCSGLPTTQVANADYSPCTGKVTGNTCTPACKPGYAQGGTSQITLVCASTGQYMDTSGITCPPWTCKFGPDVAAANADYTTCNALSTGGQCTPTCTAGYTATGASAFTILCTNNKYPDTSGIACNPNDCTAGAATPAAQADYSSCMTLKTGGRCTPTCATGYQALTSRTFILSCSAAKTFVDGSNVQCGATKCVAGPSNAANGADYTACNALSTGAQCTPTCKTGFVVLTSATAFPLVCDPMSGYADTSGVSCRAGTCTAGASNAGTGVDYSRCTGLKSGGKCTVSCQANFVQLTTNKPFDLACINNQFVDQSGIQCTNSFDECTVMCAQCPKGGQFCALKSQVCVDPNPNVRNDWRCECSSPSIGAPGVTSHATCQYDECTRFGTTCTAVGQTCTDPNTAASSTADWTCNCAGATGSAVGRSAVCVYPGECAANAAACTANGQTCYDSNPNVNDDWQCVCVAPMVGQSGRGVPATCTLDECTAIADICKVVGQVCKDRNTDPNSKGDWECVCPRPQTGKATAAVAQCTLDECVSNREVCASAGQMCVDVNTSPSSTGDWNCTCINAVGTMRARAAVCQHSGECLPYSGTCSTVGQSCKDPSGTAGDWLCECVPPQIGQPGVAAAAVCTLDECALTGTSTTCTDAGQTCTDPNRASTSRGDWTCNCVAPATGVGVAGVASCVLDECEQYGVTCSASGQICHDPDKSGNKRGDWMCMCVAPATGSARARTAACQYAGECVPYSSTCTVKGQTCVDPTAASGDWQCQCVSPKTGSARDRGPAVCFLDECLSVSACRVAGQACNDPNISPTVLGDWECLCPPPSKGKTVGRAAQGCVLDECIEKGPGVCFPVGQMCLDPNTAPSSLGDWVCTCPSPSSGSAVARAASCAQTGECVPYGSVCVGAGQGCKDPGNAAGDWQCECVTPAVGSPATGRAAVCVLNECLLTDRCLAGQTCEDLNTNPRSTGDWVCRCDAPSVGMQTAGSAVCTLDECLVHSLVCAAVGQSCLDPDKNVKSVMDWICSCAGGANGTAVATAATCVYPGECAAYSSTCMQAGQTCVDPSPAVGDWRCECVSPQTGTPVTAAVATCLLDECKLYRPLCADRGQTCVDPTMSSASRGDWSCKCVYPAVGVAVAAHAMCMLDECLDTAKSSICSSGGQTCKDENTSPTSVNDWVCNCVQPSIGSKVAAAAACVYQGECLSRASACTAAGQTCADPSLATADDWQCRCVAPTTGAARTAGPATCILDECVARCASCAGTVCTDAGQTCNDPDTSPNAKSDWTCTCNPPATGAARANAAVCVFDECITQGATCTASGQQCTDPNTAGTSINDWTCTCIAPSTGQAVVSAATCAQKGECVTHFTVCTSKGQYCDDLSTGPDDWVCKCPPPQTGVVAARSPAVCTLDECVAVCPTCANRGSGNVCTAAGQTCDDPDTSPKTTGDWKCVCPGAGNFVGLAKPARCRLDECAQAVTVCQSSAQLCRDVNMDPKSTGDWQCECVAPATGMRVMGAAQCVYTGECAPYSSTCTTVGQTCVDPSNTKGDWRCECVAPMTGTPSLNKPASCELDECVAVCPTCADSGFGNVCASAGQVCVEKSKLPSAKSDWECRCKDPLRGTGLAAVAQCVHDECRLHTPFCQAAGQKCVDANTSPSSLGDWSCECVAPATGTSVASLATCVFTGECVPYSGICTTKGQTCNDPSSAVGDWQCLCVQPQVGAPGLNKPALCTLNECTDNVVCAQAGQACIDTDPSPTSINNWSCACKLPAVGRAVGRPAQCGVDECATQGFVCTSANQRCVDLDLFATGTWKCMCAPPAIGEAVATVANCVQDECVGNSTVCTDFGQVCQDTSTNPINLGDWVCRCVDSNVSSRAAPAPCSYNECLFKGATCTSVGQTCVDLNNVTTSLGDWSCVCPEPYTGSKIGAPAKCLLDECILSSGTCAAEGQNCLDTNQTTQGDWTCVCKTPFTGSPRVGGVADCQMDECLNADTAKICNMFGQNCVDPNISPQSLGDWTCRCSAPLAGIGQRTPANCTIDECGSTPCDTCAGTKCSDARQLCNDPDWTIYSNWVCQCKAPTTGVPALKKPTQCILDECTALCATCAGATCSSQMQNCKDLNTSSLSRSDWLCECREPLQGAARGGAAPNCIVDECQTDAAQCSRSGQTCKDPNTSPSSLNDWSCSCAAPSVGIKLAGTATCVHEGECAQRAGTCTAAGQGCGDKSVVDGDWYCFCVLPATGSAATAKVATCVFDECQNICQNCADQGYGNRCALAGQKCVDPVKTIVSLHDWSCECQPPFSGSATRGPAVCTTNECPQRAAVCEAADQTCTDPTDALNDWECTCKPPLSGKGVAEAATCVATDECLTEGHACIRAGQTCEDQSGAQSDWACVCKPPLYGKMVRGVASCLLNECASVTICSEALRPQTCFDPNHNLTATNDWRCVCTAPATGFAVGKFADCFYDECANNRKTCMDAGQMCFDADTSAESLNDWSCNCVGSSVGGKKVAGVATCQSQGACVASGPVCANASQACTVSSNSSSTWQCECIAPAQGTPKVGGVTLCTLDECVGATCPEGQTCVDPRKTATSLGDYYCLNNECQTNPCGADQTCTDPTNTAGDFICSCTGTLAGTKVGGRSTCWQDECGGGNASVCTAGQQTCVDPSALLEDWRCVCPSPNPAFGTKKLADCTFNECTAAVPPCKQGEGCSDPDMTKAGTFVCTPLISVAPPTPQPGDVSNSTDVPETAAPTDVRGGSPDDGTTKWYRKWWVWLIAALLLCCSFVACATTLRNRKDKNPASESTQGSASGDLNGSVRFDEMKHTRSEMEMSHTGSAPAGAAVAGGAAYSPGGYVPPPPPPPPDDSETSAPLQGKRSSMTPGPDPLLAGAAPPPPPPPPLAQAPPPPPPPPEKDPYSAENELRTRVTFLEAELERLDSERDAKDPLLPSQGHSPYSPQPLHQSVTPSAPGREASPLDTFRSASSPRASGPPRSFRQRGQQPSGDPVLRELHSLIVNSQQGGGGAAGPKYSQTGI